MTIAAQNLTGQITDASGTPIPDAYIFLGDGIRHAHSNEVGYFALERAGVGDTLQVSALGFSFPGKILEADDFDGMFFLRLRERSYDLGQVVISNDLRAISRVSEIDLLTNPVQSSQEVLRTVPGLFIAQHAGGGKAEQIFLRGFDIDHGTDVNLQVDGLPVNMVSHAHGQGYADLHWLIPEIIERIDFGKGPYYANKGNFTTAGYVQFETKDRLKGSMASLEIGDFSTLRTLALVDLLGPSQEASAYLAGEFLQSDGPFESSQNFNRVNLLGKFVLPLPGSDRLEFMASHFQSSWDASGQIPQRAVDSGIISRFGAIDDTEGGQTSRTNLALEHTADLGQAFYVKNRAYYSHYDFELFSNFTFFLENPIDGDQIVQRENRDIFGLESVAFKEVSLGNSRLNLQGGLGLRFDDVAGNELSHTVNRKTTLDSISFGNVRESNIYAFAKADFDFGKFLVSPGVRLDHFRFSYENTLSDTYQNRSVSKSIVTPKLNFVFNPDRQWQFFLKTGMGFHSNDSRVVVAQEGNEILPAAYGVDLGAVWKPFTRIWVSMAGWYLFLEQEFVYVGDAGVVEPSGRSRRLGLDASLRYQLFDWLYLNGDVNYAFARSIDEPEGADYIPLAPDLTASGGLAIQHPSGLSGGFHFRQINSRPANEDGSITALGYSVFDANLNYQLGRLSLGLIAENLFNTEWNEAQFATESRLQDEPAPVEELHFTPGVPFYLRGKVAFRW